MKVDFKKIAVVGIDGKKFDRDCSKEIGNVIYSTTKDIGELELARAIYLHGEVDLTVQQAQTVKRYVEQQFLAWVKEALLPILDKVINNKK